MSTRADAKDGDPPGDAAQVAVDPKSPEPPAPSRSEIRRPTPVAPLGAAQRAPMPPGRAIVPPPSPASPLERTLGSDKPTVPPKVGGRIPAFVLESPRVVQGARRPGDPPPAPLPPPARALPKLPRASGAGPTPLPPRPDGTTPSEPAEEQAELDSLEIELDVAPKAPSEPPSRAAPKTSTTQLPAICTYGRFEILGRIAFGGMAEIFLGRESTSVGATRLLAIKRILPHVADDPQFVEMFLDEARLAIQLNHPYICHIYEFGELEGSYFIAMEWIHGAQLGKIIRRARKSGGIPPETGARIVAYVAEALHYAHRARDANGQPLGIVHRDVSPHNVMVSYDGQVKLLDFGIAKAQSHTTKTQAGVVKGKFSYMSPQQCLGKDIDARADVFALGICLYEVLTGETLYNRPTEYETMRAVIEDPVPSIRDKKPELPVALDAIVRKALQKSPSDRFRSAGEMQTAIEDWLAGTGKAITTARIGELMEQLFEDKILAGPLVDSTPFGASFQRRSAVPGGSGPSSISGMGSAASASGARAVAGGDSSGASLAAASSPSGVIAAPGSAELGAEDALPIARPRSRTALVAAIGVVAAIAMLGVGLVAGGALGGGDPRAGSATTALGASTTPAVAPPPPGPDTEPGSGPETEAAPLPAAEAHLVVRVPEGAIVRIGERTLASEEIGASLALAPGSHLLHVEREGHRPYDREIVLAAGAEEELEPELVPLPRGEPGPRAPAAPPGQISINTRPWSKVWVGSRLLGTTPIGEATVPSGTVRLRIVDRDGRTFSRSVRVAPGATESVFFDLDQ